MRYHGIFMVLVCLESPKVQKTVPSPEMGICLRGTLFRGRPVAEIGDQAPAGSSRDAVVRNATRILRRVRVRVLGSVAIRLLFRVPDQLLFRVPAATESRATGHRHRVRNAHNALGSERPKVTFNKNTRA